jgi:biotin carboxyl carrier protein
LETGRARGGVALEAGYGFTLQQLEIHAARCDRIAETGRLSNKAAIDTPNGQRTRLTDSWKMLYHVLIDGKSYELDLSRTEAGWRCRLDDREVELDAVLARRDVLSVIIDGKAYEVKREVTADDLHLWVGSARYGTELRDPRSLRNRRSGAGAGEGPRKLVAPMPGKVVRLLAKEKDEIEAGQGVVVVEAMKMQNEIKSPKKGVIKQLPVREGTAVNAGDVLAIVE